jgi:hypothetical protein
MSSFKDCIFGVDVSKLEMVQDSGNAIDLLFDKYKGFTIPKSLSQLRQSLVKNGGLGQEGIFRVAGSEKQMKEIKIQLNSKTFTDSNAVHCLATLLKVICTNIGNIRVLLS